MRPAAQRQVLVVGRPATQPVRVVAPSSARPAVVAPPRRPETAKVAPPPPLTEEEIAAKAAVDEILEREPALAAARERPDPRLVRAITAKHDEQERRLAARKLKEESEEARRKKAAEKLKARQHGKAAKETLQSGNGRATPGSVAVGTKAASVKSQVVVVPPQPRRMPTPD